MTKASINFKYYKQGCGLEILIKHGYELEGHVKLMYKQTNRETDRQRLPDFKHLLQVRLFLRYIDTI